MLSVEGDTTGREEQVKRGRNKASGFEGERRWILEGSTEPEKAAPWLTQWEPAHGPTASAKRWINREGPKASSQPRLLRGPQALSK